MMSKHVGTRLATFIVLLVVAVVSLGGCVVQADQPGAGGASPTASLFDTTPPDGAVAGPGSDPVAAKEPVAIVVVDLSQSVLGTDLEAAAQNKLLDLVTRMPVGSKVVLRGLNNNVTALCTDAVFVLPSIDPTTGHPINDARLTQLRQANEQLVPSTFQRHVDCVTEADRGGTELFGGLTQTLRQYPNATVIDAYTDGCDTFTDQGNICRPKRLASDQGEADLQAALLQELAPTTPQVNPAEVITYHGLARYTGLTAPSVTRLTSLIGAWTSLTGAQSYFLTS